MSEQAVFDALKYHIEVDEDGSRRYYNTNDELHRTDGPAVEYADGGKGWCQNGQLHRIDGPAIEWRDGDKHWYINGVKMTESEFLAATQPAVEMTVTDIEKLIGKRVKIIK